LPATQVASDLDYFIQHYASLPAFQLFSKPLVIWSGTWKFSTQEIEQVTLNRRNSLLILASERNTDGYNRLANLVDGNAYYWSSVNPDTYPNYQDKLNQMSELVHTNKGLWIAPAAPGFDARLIGGTTVVDRKDGATFRTEINTAMASSPDALGIISWNEFSENSHIEPSQNYGNQYLNIVSEINQTPSPNVIEFDSSIPNHIFPELVPGSRTIALGGLLILILVSVVLIILRK
jgi:Glycosyltransferase WbsX